MNEYNPLLGTEVPAFAVCFLYWIVSQKTF